jgi:hypothetical protein
MPWQPVGVVPERPSDVYYRTGLTILLTNITFGIWGWVIGVGRAVLGPPGRAAAGLALGRCVARRPAAGGPYREPS